MKDFGPLSQLTVIPAGCQPWSKNVICSSIHENSVDPEQPSARFAYCSTLAMYLFEYYLPRHLRAPSRSLTPAEPIPPQKDAHVTAATAGTFRLKKVFAEFDSNTSCITWNPVFCNQVAIATGNDLINICDVKGSLSITQTIKTAEKIKWMAFCPSLGELLVYQEDKLHLRFHHAKFQLTLSHDAEITAVHWHPRVANQLVYGDVHGKITVCDVHYQGAKFKVTKKKLELVVDVNMEDLVTASATSSKDSNPVEDLKFDPHSDSYLLIAYRNGRLLLGDTASGRLISAFTHQSNKISCIHWVPHIPGGFITADSRAGILRLWTVSQTIPLRVEKLHSSPIHSIAPLLPTHKASGSFEGYHMLSRFYIVAFTDGSLGVYDLAAFHFVYLRQGGHTETIFCCDFKPQSGIAANVSDQNYSIFATGSYDGTIKIWDLNDSTNLPVASGTPTANSTPSSSNVMGDRFRSALNGLWVNKNVLHGQYDKPGQALTKSADVTLLDSFPPMGGGRTNEVGAMETIYGIWYSVSWAKDNSFRLVAGSSRGTVVVYNARLARVVCELKDFHKGPIFHVAWNPIPKSISTTGAGLVASTSGDGYCFVFKPEDGTIVKRYRHPDEAIGCDWHPFSGEYVATGCKDGRVQVFDITQNKDSPKITFLGHKARSFNVVWSPLVPFWLASGSDDLEIRVWNTSTESCQAVLRGHTKKVRGLFWSTVCPQILISGSWDSVIRVWNVRTSECISIFCGHVADVYGLAPVSSHPLLFVSTSRDNTMRIWTLELVLEQLKFKILKALAARCYAEAAEILYCDFADKLPPEMLVLSGERVRQMADMIIDNSVPDVEKFHKVLDLFSPVRGTTELWSMAKHLSTNSKSSVQDLQTSLSTFLLPKTMLPYQFELRAQAKEPVKLIQQLQSSNLVVPLAKSIPAYLNVNDVLSNEEDEGLNNTLKIELRDVRDAAYTRSKLGQFKRYCETLCNLGEWEKALSIAPAVGLDYWQSLNRRYCKRLLSESNLKAKIATVQTVVPLMLGCGDITTCVDYLLEIGHIDEAYLIASLAESGTYGDPTVNSVTDKLPTLTMNSSEVEHKSLSTPMSTLVQPKKPDLVRKVATVGYVKQVGAKNDITNFEAVKLGAAWKLVIGDIKGAVRCLMDGAQLDHALGLASVFDLYDEKNEILQLIQTLSLLT